MNDLLEQVGALFGAEKEEEVSTAETFELLCQVALALLIIFVMANTIFRSRAQAQIDAAKGQLGVLGAEMDELTKTDKGYQYTKRVEALMDVQRQKLLLGLEEVLSDVRNSFGLTHFGTTNEKGEREYLLSDILSQGKVVNERFKRGCVLADQVLSNQEQMQQDLLRRVLLKKGMVLNQSSVEPSLVENPEIVSGENAQWLLKQISSQVKAIYTDCCIMQKTALAYLMEHQEHILMDVDLNEQLERVLEEASEQEKLRRISEFSQRHYQHVKSLFDKQNVPLLGGV